MDINTINNVTHVFLEKNKLSRHYDEKEISNFLLETLREVRDTDFDFYQEMYEMPKSQQIAILTERLNMKFVPNYFDIYTESCATSKNIIGTVLEDIDYFDPNDNYLTEDIKTIGKNIFSKSKEASKSIIESTTKYFIKIASAMAPIIGLATTVSASFMINIPFGLFMILLWITGISNNYGPYRIADALGLKSTKRFLELVGDVSDGLIALGKLVKKSGEKYKYKFIVTLKNEEKCYKRAGISPDDINMKKFTSIDKLDSADNDLDVPTTTALIKLRNCYLENYLDRIGVLFDMYFDCLHKTGNWTKVQSLSDDKFIQMLRLRGSFYEMCDEYGDQAKKMIKTYEDLVDNMFETKAEKSKWDLLLVRFLLDKRDLRKYNREDSREAHRPFDKTSKYNKYTSDVFK